MSHVYEANGLVIRSEIEMPEMIPVDGRGPEAPDVVLRFGSTPKHLDDVVLRGPRFELGREDYLLEVDGVARYWVRSGRTVDVCPAPGATDSDIRTFILSSVMGVLAHQNRFLPMHASAVVVDGRCVLLAGDSGTGKSTLAATFHRHGYPVVSDDLCALSMGPDGVVAHRGYRHLRLWRDAVERIGANPSHHRRVRVGLPKYSVSLTETVDSGTIRVAGIFELSARLDRRLRIEELTGRAKLAAIIRHTYRLRLVRALSQRDTHFSLCSSLARSTPVLSVGWERTTRGIEDRLDALVERLSTELQSRR